ncbi:hypothetical protein KIW84_040413 [Lathyrus oleraceus]|uniref:Uncharacterized protein n=1 Tax=Pisum sativum TaxID=3888 RepID=A0A9D4X709_PEA|nr:hypothetical protein KIW84_040413 [Pisum sativum]
MKTTSANTKKRSSSVKTSSVKCPKSECNHSHNFNPPSEYFKYNCPSFDIYYDRKQHSNVTKEKARSFSSSCSLLQFPSKDLTDTENILSFVSGQMVVKIVLSADCEECCNHKGGQCRPM